MSHFILKLTSGENVFGSLDITSVATDKKMVIVENPMIWEEYENPETGQVGTALVKYMTGSSETKIPVALSAIVSIAAMSNAFSNFYEAAVAVSKITDEAYEERLVSMTRRMVGLVIDYQDKAHAEATGDLVITSSDTDTIH